MIKHFESTAQICREFERWGQGCEHDFGGNSWYGNESHAETLSWSKLGNSALVPDAEKILRELDTNIEVPTRTWEPSFVGAFPCVPDFLSGFPMPMRRLQEQDSDTNPINIYVNIVSSGGVDARVLHKRGIAILALVMALSRVRPLSLFALATMHGEDTGETVFVTRINTAPLDLATACYALTSQGFSRRLNYQLGEKLNGFNGSWPTKWDYGTSGVKYTEGLRERLGLDAKHTLMITATQLNDEIVQQPLKWVQNQVNRFTNPEED